MKFAGISLITFIIFTVAIQKINEIIKTEHQSSLNRPSRFTNAPPPLMSLHTGVPSVVSFFFENNYFSLFGIIERKINTNIIFIYFIFVLGKNMCWNRKCPTGL